MARINDPNMAFAPGSQVLVLSPMVMRADEELSSEELRHLAEGEVLSVQARGTGETGRRLRVVMSDGAAGWISCQTITGKPLVAPCGQPALPHPASAPAWGTAIAGGPCLNESFIIGSEVRALDKMILRAGEELQSMDVRELSPGARLQVLGRGTGPSGRRLFVGVMDSGEQGWISCFSQSGRQLIEPAMQSGVHDVAMGGIVPASSSTAPAPVRIASHSPAQKPNEAFPIGSSVINTEMLRVRAGEELTSAELMELPAGTRLAVLAHGVSERRLLISIPESGFQGWISCISTSGMPLLMAVSGSEALCVAPVALSQAGAADASRSAGISPGSEIPSAYPGSYAPPSQMAASPAQVFGSVPVSDQPESCVPPHFEAGSWTYICVDPTGLRLREVANYAKNKKTGRELKFGEVVTITCRGCERNILWLCLADGRGWAFERTNRRRMSQVNYEEVPNDQHWLLLNPTLRCATPLACTPHIPAALASRNLEHLLPGTEVRMKRQVTVIFQSPNDGKKEMPRTFIEVVDKESHVGWLPSNSSTGEQMLVDYTAQPLKPPQNWIAVLPNSQAVATKNPGFPVTTTPGQKLPSGEFLEVSLSINVCDHQFFKLAAQDLWVCEAPSGKAVVELVVLEQHWWAYVCNDTYGADIRDTPTRAKITKTGEKLKHRQRVFATDKAAMRNGDEFIHLGPPYKGWVPLTKRSGAPKMQALNAVPPSTGAWGGGKYPIQARPPGPQQVKQKAKVAAREPEKTDVTQSMPATNYRISQIVENVGDFSQPLPLRRSFDQSQLQGNNALPALTAGVVAVPSSEATYGGVAGPGTYSYSAYPASPRGFAAPAAQMAPSASPRGGVAGVAAPAGEATYGGVTGPGTYSYMASSASPRGFAAPAAQMAPSATPGGGLGAPLALALPPPQGLENAFSALAGGNAYKVVDTAFMPGPPGDGAVVLNGSVVPQNSAIIRSGQGFWPARQ